MSFDTSKAKRPADAFSIVFKFINKDPQVVYTIQEIIYISLIQRSDNQDMGPSMLDLDLNTIEENKAYIWVQGGTLNELYDLEVSVIMESGEQLSQKIELAVRDRV